jgi:hypothetical protein
MASHSQWKTVLALGLFRAVAQVNPTAQNTLRLHDSFAFILSF